MSEMSELTLTIIRLGFLAVLWLFVLTAVSVMRSDLFGRRVAPRAAAQRPAPPPPSRANRPPKPTKGRRGAPSTLVVTQGALTGTSVRLGDTAGDPGPGPGLHDRAGRRLRVEPACPHLSP